ncbi:WD repeat protein Lub1 [Fusarium falciforme]
MADFKLSAQLVGHESDVRAVSFPFPDTVLTASRDCSVRVWRRTQDSPPSFDPSLLSRGSEYINSIAYFPPSSDRPDGLVLSGGKDTIIEAKSPKATSSDNAERLLVGHAHNVCALNVAPNGTYAVSGGWDGQARVWNPQKWETELMLTGHESMAVWAVVAVDDRTVLTGCADKNIRIFDLRQSVAGEVSPKSTIHTPDVVRALTLVPEGHPSGADIASASNDGTIRLWKFNGQQVAELHGHESFVYSLTSLPTGELVSSGEDRTVRIWRGTECVQTITHPAISVWTVAANAETGDIVTGASDSISRVFTRSPERTADEATLKEFEEAVKSSSIPQQQVGGINKEKLPGPEFLTSKSGTKEGQVQMIKEDNGAVTAHQWSMSQQQWVNVGTVVDAVASTGKKVEYNGQMYDYVFDVDIEDGKPPLKLPYNLSENPYDRATKFLGDNELPISYLDNVANFITENTKGATIGQTSGPSGPDPLGTESRYRPGEETQPKVLPPKGVSQHHSRQQSSTRFSPSTRTWSLPAAKTQPSTHQTNLYLPTSAPPLNPPDQSPQTALPLLVRILTQWPYSDRLAGLDLLRCVAKYPLAAQFSDPEVGSLLDLAIAASLPEGEKPSDNAAMMGLRTLANMFSSANGRSIISAQSDKAIALLERVVGVSTDPIGPYNRNVLIATTTAAINLSVLVHRERLLTPDQRRRLAVVLGAILSRDGQTDSEVLYRALVALGTLLSASKAEIKGLGVKGWIQGAASGSVEDRVKAVAAECAKLAP